MQDGGDALLGDLQVILEPCPTAVLVKDEHGYCIFANKAAESLLRYQPGQLAGMYMTDLGPADPRLILMEYERLKREKAWMGRYPIRLSDGSIIQVAASALARSWWDGRVLCLEFLYPLDQRLPATQPEPGLRQDLSKLDLSLLQLMVEGFSDDELAVLLGISNETVRESVGRVLLKLNVRSKTEACVTAMKAHFVI